MTQITAWMGGSRPAKLSAISQPERLLVSEIFWRQCFTYRRFWGEAPSWDTYRIFWSRARHDAHATFRREAGYLGA